MASACLVLITWSSAGADGESAKYFLFKRQPEARERPDALLEQEKGGRMVDDDSPDALVDVSLHSSGSLVIQNDFRLSGTAKQAQSDLGSQIKHHIADLPVQDTTIWTVDGKQMLPPDALVWEAAKALFDSNMPVLSVVGGKVKFNKVLLSETMGGKKFQSVAVVRLKNPISNPRFCQVEIKDDSIKVLVRRAQAVSHQTSALVLLFGVVALTGVGIYGMYRDGRSSEEIQQHLQGQLEHAALEHGRVSAEREERERSENQELDRMFSDQRQAEKFEALFGNAAPEPQGFDPLAFQKSHKGQWN